jgi:RHS repeat-associated protein
MTTLTGSHNYSYDPTYQLTQATHPASSTENYTYGPVHNRLTSTGHSNWTYNNTNELVSYNSTTFNYDANGNTISKTDASGTSDYQSDYENRLKRIDNPDGTYSEYHYDPFGNRIKKDVNGLVTWFVYDLMKKLPDVITEYDNSGSLLSSYTHGPGIDEVISMRRGGSSYFYLKDGLGSTTSLSDNTEILVNTYEYDAFGNVISKTETVSNPYGYTGRSFDSESGLMYYRARYYDPITGRFITVDPIGFNGGINSYIYVANNPINLVDPDGEVAVVAAIAACMAAAPCRALVGCVVGAIGSDVMGTIEDLIFRKFDLCKTLGCGAICGCVFGAITAGVAGPDATIIGIIFGKTIKDLLIGQLKGRSCGFACSETVCKDEECEKIDGKDPRL